MSSETPTFGPYRLDEMLGRGGMGEVYRALDTEHRRTVAVKRLAPHLADDPEFQLRFRREARVAAQLRSPHVIPIHRFGEIDGQLYIDMRYVDGGDLQELIQSTGGLALDRAVAILEQVAHAVDDAHANGLVHRDVKPSNILLDTAVHDFCYLGDFGITRAAATSTTSNSLTRTGALLGSLAYMAPEQFDGALTKRSDVYSLTCVFFEMITGARPYAGEGLPALMHSHLKIPPPRPSDRNPGTVIFDDLVTTGMAKDATLRFASAGELARAARSALDSHRNSATIAPTSTTSPPAPPAPEPEIAAADDDGTTTASDSPPPRTHVPAPASASGLASPRGADDPTEDLRIPAERLPHRTTRSARRWLVPLGAVLAVLALITGTWALASPTDAGRSTALLPASAPTPSAATPTDSPTSAVAAPVPAGPVLTEAVFTGRTSGNELTLAVGVKDGHAAGYLCDGHTIEAWLEGTIAADRLTLHGRAADTGITATVDQRSLLGTASIGGTVHPFSAQIATGAAGLFQNRRTINGISTRIGWIVLPDGSQVGIRHSGDDRRPAPALDPNTLRAVDDGQPISAERLSGASTVLGS